MKRYFSFGAGVAVGLVLLVLAFLFIETDPPYAKKQIQFSFEGQQVVGQITLPLGAITQPLDCIVLVHGDGAMERDAHGFYASFYSYFADRNMCTLSWDKPGVGQSEGNWLQFDMEKRARLVGAAIDALRGEVDLKVNKIGLMGFSQAGWVMPKLDPKSHDIDFMIFVSPAVNWMRQSAYMTNLRIASGEKQEAEIAYDRALDALLIANGNYQDYLALAQKYGRAPQFDPDRWHFVSANAHADLTTDLERLKSVPVLLLAGAYDGQVDALETVGVFRAALPPDHLTVRLFEKAGHSMLPVDEKKPMDDWDGLALVSRVALFGRGAFVEEFWATLNQFLAAQN